MVIEEMAPGFALSAGRFRAGRDRRAEAEGERRAGPSASCFERPLAAALNTYRKLSQHGVSPLCRVSVV